MGNWNSITDYVIGDIVIHEDLQYSCIISNTGAIPTDTLYWVYVWESDVLYDAGEVVLFNNEEYRLYETYDDGIEYTVGDDPDDSRFWIVRDRLTITGTDGIYDMEAISRSTDRMSGSSIIIGTGNNVDDTGNITIAEKTTFKLPNATLNNWTDFNKKMKR